MVVTESTKDNMKLETLREFLDFMDYRSVGQQRKAYRMWSRLSNTKGRVLIKGRKQLNCNVISTEQYWPTDVNKIPDLFDLRILYYTIEKQ